MIARSSAYTGHYPDGYMSQSTAYSGSYPDGYPLGSLLKDKTSPTMIAQNLTYTGPHLEAT